MRPWLRWLLAFSSLSSIAALFWPDGVSEAVVRTEASLSGASTAWPAGASTGSASVSPQVAPARLPPQLPGIALEKPHFDPFLGVQPPPPPPPPPAPPPVATIALAPPPAAPAFDYRYLGRMVDPTGKPFVYLGRLGASSALGSDALAVAVGTRLDEGYVVEAIDDAVIRLTYPPLDTHVVIDIPPAQETSVR